MYVREETECVGVITRKCLLVSKISTLVTGQGTYSIQTQSQKLISGLLRELFHWTYLEGATTHQQIYLSETQAGCAANTNHHLLPSELFLSTVPPSSQLRQSCSPDFGLVAVLVSL